MTTLDLSITMTLHLGEKRFSFVPVMGVTRLMGQMEAKQAQAKAGEEAMTAEDAAELTDLLTGICSRGTKRHHSWEEVEEAMDDLTYPELLQALTDMMEAGPDQEQPDRGFTGGLVKATPYRESP